MTSTRTGSDVSKKNSLSTSIAVPSCGGREHIWIDGMEVENKTARGGSHHVGSAQSSRRSGITLRRRCDVPVTEATTDQNSASSSLGSRKRFEDSPTMEYAQGEHKKRHESTVENDEWGWFVDVPFSPGSIARSPIKSIPKGGSVPTHQNQLTSSPLVTPKKNVNEEAEQIIGKSNSLLELWESMSVGVNGESIQTRGKHMKHSADAGNTSPSATDPLRETIPKVTSFCFDLEM